MEIGCFEGNTAETTTIVPIITSFLERHNLAGTPVVVAADAGMLSGTNLKALDELGLSFIVGSRVTKAPPDLESHFHWNGDVEGDPFGGPVAMRLGVGGSWSTVGRIRSG